MESKYSIKDLERLSGIKAHTIRIWEQRYEVIKPKRTDTNIRYYNDSDLRKILNVSFLVHHGTKISKVAQLSDAELNQSVLDRASKEKDFSSEVNALNLAMFQFDQDEFDRVFKQCIDTHGEETTFTKVLGAFLEQMGVLWQTQTISVSHEHFVSNLIKQKIYAAIDRVEGKVKKDAKTYLLFLPSNELHEIGLLHIQYVLKKNGQRVIFLGQNTPMEYVIDVYKKNPFDVAVGIFTTSPHGEDVSDYLLNFKKKMNGYPVKCKFSGYQLSNTIDEGFNDPMISLYKNVSELRKELIS